MVDREPWGPQTTAPIASTGQKNVLKSVYEYNLNYVNGQESFLLQTLQTERLPWPELLLVSHVRTMISSALTAFSLASEVDRLVSGASLAILHFQTSQG